MWEGGSRGRSKPKPGVGGAAREGLRQVIRNGEKVEEGERVEGTGEREMERKRQSKEVGIQRGTEMEKGERKSELRGDPEGQRIWDGGGEETGKMDD